MRTDVAVEWLKKRTSRLIGVLRVHPITFLKRVRGLMASVVAWLIGLTFFGVGCWILLLRIEGLVDLFNPNNMSIGQMMVDGTESKSHAELLRARFDHHFRRPVSIPKDTGFLEVVSFDAPGLFQQKGPDGELRTVTVEVSGVDVTKLVQFVNQLAKPDQWVVEGDFQTQSDRAVLALRLRRGARLIRTWYLERRSVHPRNASEDKSLLLEQLVDDAIFQLVYDFANPEEQDADLQKWRRIVPALPPGFPSAAAAAAYYEARGALGRYYAHSDWKDLDVALDRLRTLRAHMPDYVDGLQLLAMTLAEKREETEAIVVYEHLRQLLEKQDGKGTIAAQRRRRYSVDLLKATATAKLFTWQSAHEAVAELSQLHRAIKDERNSTSDERESAAYTELLAHTAVQLAYTYSLYLDYLRRFGTGDVLGSANAPQPLHMSDPAQIELLRKGSTEKADVVEAKSLVRTQVQKVAEQHQYWLNEASNELGMLEKEQWSRLPDAERRKAELVSRLHLAAGYAKYRMAEWESRESETKETVFGTRFEQRLNEAAQELRAADAAHPNHYLVLQLLGLVYSEPRREEEYLGVAEQFFERAIRANPSDYAGHELLASVLLHRVLNRGIDLASRDAITKGLEEAREAVVCRETSGNAHLLRAQFQTMLLEVERDAAKRRELRAGLDQYVNEAERFLPKPFGNPDPDLEWVRIVAATRRVGEDAEGVKASRAKPEDVEREKEQRFAKSKNELKKKIAGLIGVCSTVEQRWVAQQRAFLVRRLKDRLTCLSLEVEKARLENWREIPIPFQDTLCVAPDRRSIASSH